LSSWQAVEGEGKGQNDRGSIGKRGGGNSLQGRYCFLCFFRPADERKNPDWLDFMNYPICCFDWSTPVIQERWSSQIHSFNMLTQIVGLNYP